MELIEKVRELLASRLLGRGKHATFENGFCAMEAIAYLAGEPFTDAPECACPVIASYVRRINDSIPDDEMRTRLLGPVLHKLVGTRGSRELGRRRAYLLADCAVRQVAPLALEAAKRHTEAAQLRALPAIHDKKTAEAGRKAARDAAAAYAYAAAAAYAYAAYAADAAYAAADAAAAAADAAAAAYAADAARHAAREKVFTVAVAVIEKLCDMKDAS